MKGLEITRPEQVTRREIEELHKHIEQLEYRLDDYNGRLERSIDDRDREALLAAWETGTSLAGMLWCAQAMVAFYFVVGFDVWWKWFIAMIVCKAVWEWNLRCTRAQWRKAVDSLVKLPSWQIDLPRALFRNR